MFIVLGRYACWTAVLCRRFGISCWSGLAGYPKTSVSNYCSVLHKGPQERRSLSTSTFTVGRHILHQISSKSFNGLGYDIRRGASFSMYLVMVYTTSVNNSEYIAPKIPDSYWKTNGKDTAGLADNLGYYRQISPRGLQFTSLILQTASC